MKNAHLSKTMPFILILMLAVTAYAQNNQTYTLQYKFKAGDQLTYKTESVDSMSGGGMFGGDSENRPVTSWSLQTVTISGVPSSQSYQVTIKTDSTWSDRVFQPGGQRPEGGFPGGGERPEGETFSRTNRTGGGFAMGMMGGMRRSGSEMIMEITAEGKPAAQNTTPSPLFIVLPDKPIAVNGTWNYETTIQMQGRQQGTMHIESQGFLYGVDKINNRSVATILVTSVSTTEGQLSMGGGEQQMTGSFSSSSEGTSFVQFDIDNGRIIEIVTDQTSNSAMETSMFSTNTTSVSQSTTELLSQ